MHKLRVVDSETLDSIEKYSRSLVEEVLIDMPVNPFLTLQQQKNEIKINLQKNVLQFIEKLILGIRAIEETVNTICQQGEKISPESIEQIKSIKRALHLLSLDPSTDKTAQEICGFSDETMNLLKRMASFLFEQEHYQQSSLVYLIVSLLDPRDYGVWMGFAHSEFFKKNYKHASTIYQCAIAVNPQDPLCHLYLSRCYWELDQQQEASSEVEKALRIIAHNHSYNDLIPQVRELKALYHSKKRRL